MYIGFFGHNSITHLVDYSGADSLEKTLMLGKIEGRSRGRQRMRWLDGITDLKEMSLSKLQEMVKHSEAWRAAVHGSQRVTHDWATEQWYQSITHTCTAKPENSSGLLFSTFALLAVVWNPTAVSLRYAWTSTEMKMSHIATCQPTGLRVEERQSSEFQHYSNSVWNTDSHGAETHTSSYRRRQQGPKRLACLSVPRVWQQKGAVNSIITWTAGTRLWTQCLLGSVSMVMEGVPTPSSRGRQKQAQTDPQKWWAHGLSKQENQDRTCLDWPESTSSISKSLLMLARARLRAGSLDLGHSAPFFTVWWWVLSMLTDPFRPRQTANPSPPACVSRTSVKTSSRGQSFGILVFTAVFWRARRIPGLC